MASIDPVRQAVDDLVGAADEAPPPTHDMRLRWLLREHSKLMRREAAVCQRENALAVQAAPPPPPPPSVSVPSDRWGDAC